MPTKQKLRPGYYKYRGYYIAHEDFEGPEGGARRCWSISEKHREGVAHAALPQLETLRAALEWVDAEELHGGQRQTEIEQSNQPKTWGV